MSSSSSSRPKDRPSRKRSEAPDTARASHPAPDAASHEEADSSGDETDPADDKQPEMPYVSQAQIMTEYATWRCELFDAPTTGPHVIFPVDGHQETSPVRSRRFRSWLHHWFYRNYYKPPHHQAMEETLRTLEAEAGYASPTHPVYLRVASPLPRTLRALRPADPTAVFVDLCNDDWEVVKITADGWSIQSAEEAAPVRFYRTSSMAALPTPRRSGSLDILRSYVRVSSDEDFALLCAYLVQCLCPMGPYPILTFTGEQGTGKSTASRFVRSLVDPSLVPLRSCPTSERDLVISANNNWILAFDNMDTLSNSLSNAFCRLATGGGFSTRRLYANREEEVFAAQRPALLNGITDLATRPDLRDRMLIVELEAIPPAERKTEHMLRAGFLEAQPYLLGALFDAVSTALNNLDAVKLEHPPRMADFARWAVAAEPDWPVPTGTFLKAYRNHQQRSVDEVLDRDAVAAAIYALLETQGRWSGTTKELLSALKKRLPDPNRPPSDFPTSYQEMGARLRRLLPVLRDLGIERVDDPRARSRAFLLRWADEESKP